MDPLLTKTTNRLFICSGLLFFIAPLSQKKTIFYLDIKNKYGLIMCKVKIWYIF